MPRLPRAAAVAGAAALVLAAAGCTKDQGSTKAFCAQVSEVPALETVLDRFTEADPTVLAERIDKARTAYDDLADAAPAEIADQTDQVVDLVNEILDAVADHPDDPAKASAQLRKALESHEGIETDRAEVAAFAQEHCDVQLDPTLSSGPGAGTSTTTTEPDTVITAPGATTSTTAPGTTGDGTSDTDSTGTTGG